MKLLDPAFFAIEKPEIQHQRRSIGFLLFDGDGLSSKNFGKDFRERRFAGRSDITATQAVVRRATTVLVKVIVSLL